MTTRTGAALLLVSRQRSAAACSPAADRRPARARHDVDADTRPTLERHGDDASRQRGVIAVVRRHRRPRPPRGPARRRSTASRRARTRRRPATSPRSGRSAPFVSGRSRWPTAFGPAATDSAGDYVVVTVPARPDMFSDLFFRDWRDTFDSAACDQAGGVDRLRRDRDRRAPDRSSGRAPAASTPTTSPGRPAT